MLNTTYQITYDRKFMVISYAYGSGEFVPNPDSPHIMVTVSGFPDNFIDTLFPLGHWMYNEKTGEIYENSEFEEKRAQGLMYDWETCEWIPDPSLI